MSSTSVVVCGWLQWRRVGAECLSRRKAVRIEDPSIVAMRYRQMGNLEELQEGIPRKWSVRGRLRHPIVGP